MGLKRKFLPHIIWFVSAPQEELRLLIKQLLVFSVTHQIFAHHIKFPRIPLSPEVVNPCSSIDHRRGACMHWSPTGLIHFIHFIKSIFSRIVKARWAEQKKNRPWRTEIPALRHVVLLLWLKRLVSGEKWKDHTGTALSRDHLRGGRIKTETQSRAGSGGNGSPTPTSLICAT